MSKPSKKQKSVQERRYTSGTIRAASKNGRKTIFGYAALFAPAQTQDMGGWREEVSPNAFDRCLRSSPDVVALFDHAGLPMARTTNGTLKLSTDKKGLKYEFEARDISLARDLVVLMQNGTIHQSSYGFVCRSESWRQDEDGTPIRVVLDADIFDVSPVTSPATLDTTSGVRKLALRNAPAVIKSKLRFRDDDGVDCDDPDNYDDPACDDDDDDDSDDCDCRCAACRDNDSDASIFYCYRCENTRCDSLGCRSLRCPAQRKRSKLTTSTDVDTTAAAALLARHLRS